MLREMTIDGATLDLNATDGQTAHQTQHERPVLYQPGFLDDSTP